MEVQTSSIAKRCKKSLKYIVGKFLGSLACSICLCGGIAPVMAAAGAGVLTIGVGAGFPQPWG